MKKSLNNLSTSWKNKPVNYIVGNDVVIFESSPFTDLWSQTFTGQSQHNASSLNIKVEGNFTFSCQVHYKYQMKRDHCGLLLYLNDETWCKVCVEYIDDQASFLSTVVTQYGHSDMASHTIGSAVDRIWYRVTHKDGCIFVEYAFDESHFKRMRLFHMESNDGCFELGLFAASPGNSSFDAEFRNMVLEECILKEYRSDKNERSRKTNKVL